MILFIDRLPVVGLFAFLPIMAVEPDRSVPRPRRHKRWKVDSGCGPEAYAWRNHLLEAGLNPDQYLLSPAEIRPSAGPAVRRPRREAHLLLFSNVPALEHNPFCLELTDGITVAADTDRDTKANYPIVGMKALRTAGMKILFNLSGKTEKVNTISVWVPRESLPKVPSKVGLFLRRAFGRFATLPILWDD